MRGEHERVFSLIPNRMGIEDYPTNNKLLYDYPLSFIQSENPAQIVLSRRYTPTMVRTKPQGILTRIQNENFQITTSGGIAIIPSHPGMSVEG